MEAIHSAVEAILEAETQIARTVQTALTASSFESARRLVDAIAALSNIRAHLTGSHAVSTSDGGVPAPLAPEFSDRSERATSSAGRKAGPIDSEKRDLRIKLPTFPQFQRDAGRLVKIGWSSKEKRTYEHRVAVDAVYAVCRFLNAQARPRKPFKIEGAGTVALADGTEIPTYQVYLVLKWLQSVGAAERKGKDGYVFKPDALAPATIDLLRQRTEERSDQ